MTGKFITFEGPEGSGKTSVIKAVKDYLIFSGIGKNPKGTTKGVLISSMTRLAGPVTICFLGITFILFACM